MPRQIIADDISDQQVAVPAMVGLTGQIFSVRTLIAKQTVMSDIVL